MRILVVEDDDRLGAYVRNGLTEEGHLVELVTTGNRGLLYATSDSFDVIILDRMLPGLDGLKILQALRAVGDHTPVLILSALGETDERVRGLKAGGDDYLPKPFAMSELVARIEVLGRRKLSDVESSELNVGKLRIDLFGHAIFYSGQRIEVTEREFRILSYLARNAGRVVTRSMLLEHVWNYNFDPQTNIIDQHVSRLRQKIEPFSDQTLIHTVRGSGYMIRAE